jgi:hypothetical protein
MEAECQISLDLGGVAFSRLLFARLLFRLSSQSGELVCKVLPRCSAGKRNRSRLYQHRISLCDFGDPIERAENAAKSLDLYSGPVIRAITKGIDLKPAGFRVTI